jgi:Pyruvate/2-oxoacid:ferredoxin oxidoreductase gamma subunit
MSERTCLMTGIGGQGVQLCAQVLARGAVQEGRHVMLFGVYGGAMRGMNTDATLVVGDGPLQSPPLLSRTDTAIGMHDRFWRPIAAKLRDGALVVVNDATFEAPVDAGRHRVVRVPATERAIALGHELGASMVMAGAYARLSGIVGIEAVVAGMRESIPSYRTQHIAANETTLRAGWELGAALGEVVTA